MFSMTQKHWTFIQGTIVLQPRKPKFVANPKNADEVHNIVKWANNTNTPLVPVSSGPPRFYGDTVPSVGGAVIVDLAMMKR